MYSRHYTCSPVVLPVRNRIGRFESINQFCFRYFHRSNFSLIPVGRATILWHSKTKKKNKKSSRPLENKQTSSALIYKKKNDQKTIKLSKKKKIEKLFFIFF